MKKKEYKLKIELTEPMLGTVPKDPDIFKRFLIGKLRKKLEKMEEGEEREEFEEKIKKMEAEEVATIEETEEGSWTGFHSDEAGLFVYDYFIRGFLKNSGNVQKDELEIRAIRSKIDKWLFVFPRRIYVEDNSSGSIKKKADDILERSLRVRTPKGERVTLARSDCVKIGSVLNCTLTVLKPKLFTEKVIREILDYGQYQGLGQFRNGSYGRFKYTLKAVKK